MFKIRHFIAVYRKYNFADLQIKKNTFQWFKNKQNKIQISP